MGLYLIETPNDRRTWRLLPTHNAVASMPEASSIEIHEDIGGSIFVEQYTDAKAQTKSYFRVSSETNKSVASDWIKRFSVK
jgi:hypothetical protein